MKIQTQVAGAVSIAIGLVFVFGTAPFWWLGAGFGAAGLALILWADRDEIGAWIESLREPRTIAGYEVVPASVAAELLCLVVMALLASVMMPQVTFGDRPVNHDHAVHFFKAWQLEQHFLAEGHLYGWSHRWFAGYPAQYLYPIGADLLVVAIDTLTLGFADLGTAYAWAIWLFWFVSGYAVYRFGALAFGRWGGLLAAVLFMTDTAANRVGGWYFAMQWGVWPMSLATVLGVWAMARVPRLMEGERWRDVAIFGALMAASLITHPFSVIHLGIALLFGVLAYWIADTERDWLAGTSRLAAGVGVGGLLASIWLVPFLAFQDEMDPGFGGSWTTLLKLGRSFYQLDFLPGTWAMAMALGIFGMFALLWSRKFEHLLIGGLSVAFILVGSSDFVAGFNLLDHLGAFERIHYKRFITLLKPYFLLAAAYGVVSIVRYTARDGLRILRAGTGDDGDETGAQPAARLWFQVFLFFACLTPLAVPFAELYGAKHVKRKLSNASEQPNQNARRDLAEWFQKKYPDGEPFFRVGMALHRHNHRFVDWGRHIPFPLYKMGYTPASAFQYRFEGSSETILKAVNVRYVVTRGRAPPGDFKQVEQFGPISLYEYQDWERDPFEVVEGEGPVQLQSWGDEAIEVRAEEGAHGRLRLNVSHFSNWTAYRDGERVPIEEVEIGIDEPNGFIGVELQPGTYRFVFERGWPEFLAYLFFLIGAGLAIAFVLADTQTRIGVRLRSWGERASDATASVVDRRPGVVDIAGLAGVFGALLAVCWLAWVWIPLDTRSSQLGTSVADVHYDFGDQLRDARVQVQKGPNATKVCDPMLGRFVCGRSAWQTIQQRVEDFGRDLLLERCIWAHPLPKGPIEIAFSDVPSGDALIGFYGVPESGTATQGEPVEFKVGVDGVYRYTGEAASSKKLSTFRIPLERRSRRGSMDVAFRISAKHTGRRHFCFNAQVVDMYRGWTPPKDISKEADEKEAAPKEDTSEGTPGSEPSKDAK